MLAKLFYLGLAWWRSTIPSYLELFALLRHPPWLSVGRSLHLIFTITLLLFTITSIYILHYYYLPLHITEKPSVSLCLFSLWSFFVSRARGIFQEGTTRGQSQIMNIWACSGSIPQPSVRGEELCRRHRLIPASQARPSDPWMPTVHTLHVMTPLICKYQLKEKTNKQKKVCLQENLSISVIRNQRAGYH